MVCLFFGSSFYCRVELENESAIIDKTILETNELLNDYLNLDPEFVTLAKEHAKVSAQIESMQKAILQLENTQNEQQETMA